MTDRIKHLFFPRVDADAQKLMDAESVKTLYYLSFTISIIELITVISYALTRTAFDRAAWVSIASVLFCAVSCFGACLMAGLFMKRGVYNRRGVLLFKLVFTLALSIWAVWNAYRQYVRSEQLITFFTVELMLICFVPFRPWINTLVTVGVYSALYAALYSIDGAQGINLFNFLVLVAVCISGSIARYHSQVRTSLHAVELETGNALLQHAYRHDGLTGLRNRSALEEDVDRVTGQPITAFMVDINYFKEINDNYGHTVGDEVLRTAAKVLEEIFPDCLCYRFGGDEFLVLDIGGKAEKRNTYRFTAPGFPETALFSIGYDEGSPKDHDELFELIARADVKLYEIKRITHSPEYGGHDRRRRK